MDKISQRRKALRKKHRKEQAIQLAFLSASLLLLTWLLSQVLVAQSVEFPNPKLKQAVRNKLGPGIITKTSITKIRSLNLASKGFEDMVGIESLWNLRTLYLSGNNLQDLTPLAGLKHLKRLYLANNNIHSLQGLEELTNLEYLDLSGNVVRDLKPLQNLTQLKELNLNYNGIPSLEAINISAMQGSNLQILRLRDNYQIQDDGRVTYLNDVAGVQALPNLRRLDLRFNNVQDLAPITQLKKLEHLDLRENGLSDIDELAKINTLRKLNLRGNQLQEISPLRSLTNLSYLNLHSNISIKTIEPIQTLTRMDTLIVRNIPIGDEVRHLANMPRLTRANLQNCSITDPQVLIDLIEQGALQDGKKRSQRAELNLLDNDIQYRDLAQYSKLRDYWDNISLKAPFQLPRPTNDLMPALSHTPGFYDDPFDLKITCDKPNVRILYTLDGSEPDVDNLDGNGKPYYVNYYNPVPGTP
ncbi:MAG: hypothetical protein GX294_07335 [Candidatus Cloacimonetes bacterium]|nr:hypothetical protein [Candidatus Cloacimonadota bacterium]